MAQDHITPVQVLENDLEPVPINDESFDIQHPIGNHFAYDAPVLVIADEIETIAPFVKSAVLGEDKFNLCRSTAAPSRGFFYEARKLVDVQRARRFK